VATAGLARLVVGLNFRRESGSMKSPSDEILEIDLFASANLLFIYASNILF
jgi:hypothetical protein